MKNKKGKILLTFALLNLFISGFFPVNQFSKKSVVFAIGERTQEQIQADIKQKEEEKKRKETEVKQRQEGIDNCVGKQNGFCSTGITEVSMTKVASLKDEITKLEDEIAKLEKELKDKEDELSKEKKAQKAQVDEKKEKETQAQKKIKTNIDQKDKEVKKLEEDKKKLEEDKKKLEEDKKKLSNQIIEMKACNQDGSPDIEHEPCSKYKMYITGGTLKAQIDKYKVTESNLESEIHKKEEEIAKIKEEIAKSKKELAKEKEKLTEQKIADQMKSTPKAGSFSLKESLEVEGQKNLEGNIYNFLGHVIDFAIGFIGAASALAILIGGVIYIVSQGNDQLQTRAKDSIIYAVIGLFLALSAYLIVQFVAHIFYHPI